jgi:hypothetical protein
MCWNWFVVLCHGNGGLLTLELQDNTASNWLYEVTLQECITGMVILQVAKIKGEKKWTKNLIGLVNDCRYFGLSE